MSISPINSTATRPASSTPTAPATAPATPKPTDPVDEFQKTADKAPVALNTPVPSDDDWAEGEFDNSKTGGGGIAAVDPCDARVIRG